MANDYRNTEDGDLLIEHGDFVVGESTHQHQKDLLIAYPGDYRFAPLDGLGIFDYINDDDLTDLGREIQRVLRSDSMTISRLEIFENGKIDLIAEYR